MGVHYKYRWHKVTTKTMNIPHDHKSQQETTVFWNKPSIFFFLAEISKTNHVCVQRFRLQAFSGHQTFKTSADVSNSSFILQRRCRNITSEHWCQSRNKTCLVKGNTQHQVRCTQRKKKRKATTCSRIPTHVHCALRRILTVIQPCATDYLCSSSVCVHFSSWTHEVFENLLSNAHIVVEQLSSRFQRDQQLQFPVFLLSHIFNHLPSTERWKRKACSVVGHNHTDTLTVQSSRLDIDCQLRG